jgi:short-subunit dehydrogenase
MKDLHGKNALLTGASRGLGPYIARALAGRGVCLILTARNGDALDGVRDEIERGGGQAVSVPADINEARDRERVLDTARTRVGPIDILINNAGVEWVCSYARLSPQEIEGMVQTNLVAPLLLSRLLLPEMIERRSGHIVMMSSLGGKKGSPYSATYASTKAGLIAWTSGIREELRGSGVSASVIAPGFVARAGMFAVYGEPAPRLAGETTPDKVAAAVIRAVEHDVGEIIVNPGPVRLMMIAEAIHPAIMTWALRLFGVYGFYRRRAEQNERAASPRSGLPQPSAFEHRGAPRSTR